MKTLENTFFSLVYNLTWSNDDEDLFDKISIVMTIFVIGSVVLNIIRPVPYGKSAVIKKSQQNHLASYHLSSKFVWRVSVTVGSRKCHTITIYLSTVWFHCNDYSACSNDIPYSMFQDWELL